MVHVVGLIQIYHAQRIVPLERITIHTHSAKQPYRGRTPTHCIGNEKVVPLARITIHTHSTKQPYWGCSPTHCIGDKKTVVKKWLENTRWIIDG
jgi:hypothetical protein